jgi:two pore calcium channel protein 1
MKPKTFFRQRAAISALVLIIMYIEAMVVLIREANHFRVTRSFRIIFFIDTYIMFGVRRVLRQIFQCIVPIIDVLVLLFFMISLFALIGKDI